MNVIEKKFFVTTRPISTKFCTSLALIEKAVSMKGNIPKRQIHHFIGRYISKYTYG